MLTNQPVRTGAALTALVLLAACGGTGGGLASGLPPAPPPGPAPTPSPTPTPTPTSVLPPAHIGLVSSAPFEALGLGHEYRLDSAAAQLVETVPADRAQTVAFRYDAARDAYEIVLPGYERGWLRTIYLNGSYGSPASSTGNELSLGESAAVQPVVVSLVTPGSSLSPYTYTALGFWDGQVLDAQGRQIWDVGQFVYGIPTAAAEMPLSGSASYQAEVHGLTDQNDFVGGSALLSFDFGAGVLSGSLHPLISDGWDLSIDPGLYTFKDTVFARGSTAFSGSFAVPGQPAAASWFEGSFNGPQAAELMARWQAPYTVGTVEGTMSGVWLGKRP